MLQFDFASTTTVSMGRRRPQDIHIRVLHFQPQKSSLFFNLFIISKVIAVDLNPDCLDKKDNATHQVISSSNHVSTLFPPTACVSPSLPPSPMFAFLAPFK